MFRGDEEAPQPGYATAALCRGCAYPLRGLTEPRCPECGRAFDPDDPDTMRLPRTWRQAALRAVCMAAGYVAGVLGSVWAAVWPYLKPITPWAACVAAGWGLSVVLGGGYLVFYWIPGLHLALARRWALLAGFVLAAPFTVAFVGDVIAYATGSPRYVNGHRVIWHPAGSVDPETRIRHDNPGCGVRSDWERLQRHTSGYAVGLMFRLIGPPPGAYDGPYPTLEQSVAALTSAAPIPPDALNNYQVPYTGGAVDASGFSLDQYCLEFFDIDRPGAWNATVRAKPNRRRPRSTLWQGRCVIVEFPGVPHDWNESYTTVFLLDARKNEMVAMYQYPTRVAPDTAQTP